MNYNINQIVEDIEEGNFTDGDIDSEDGTVDFTTFSDTLAQNQPTQGNTVGGQSEMSEQEIQALYAQVDAQHAQVDAMLAHHTQQVDDVRESVRRSDEVIAQSQSALQNAIRSRYSAAQCVIKTGVFLNMLTMGAAILINIYPQLALSLGGVTVFNCVLPLLSLGLAFLILGMLLLGLANQAARVQNMPPISTYQIMTNHLSTLFAHRNARTDSGNTVDRNELSI